MSEVNCFPKSENKVEGFPKVVFLIELAFCSFVSCYDMQKRKEIILDVEQNGL